MGRALLYWPLTAFVLAAAFPTVAVPAIVVSGAVLVVLGFVGGALGKHWRARRLRRAGRKLGALPRAVADAADPSPKGRPGTRAA